MQNFRLKKCCLLLVVATLLVVVPSCRRDNPATEEIERNNNVNNWIKDCMDVVYLWNDKLPAKTDKNLHPALYFESLLYRTEDRFSFIAEDYAALLDQLNGVTMEAGYDFTLMLMEENKPELVGLINYIKPNSPAAESSLKRGDRFRTVNGKQLTVTNYQTLAGELSSPHILGIIDGNNIKPVSLTVTKYDENPVFLDSIYNMGGKKIAYLIFNFFAPDKGDNSAAYLKKLNVIFGKYKQENIDELILDFRYNGGGDLNTCLTLASLISSRSSTELFAVNQYNTTFDKILKTEYGTDYNHYYFVDRLTRINEKGVVIEQIDLNKLEGPNRLYVLTSSHTASASEMIINGLRPYMNVVVIGRTTAGKNVGMNLFYETDPRKLQNNRWGLLPLTFKIFNSKNESDYSNGFIPTVN